MSFWGFTFLLVLALLPHSLVSQADRSGSGEPKTKKAPRAALQQEIDFDFMDVNDVLLVFENTGEIGQGGPFTAVGRFPALSPNNYVFGSGLWVGGVVNGVKQVSEAYDPPTGVSEFNSGRADGSGGDQILCSNDPAELAQWYPEFSDPATGKPIVFSPKDCVVIYNDSNQVFDVPTPIGLDVRQRTMVFTFGLLSQVVFVIWDIVNTGSQTLEEAFVGISADMDIDGGSGGFEDDRCSAIPVVPPGGNNRTLEPVETNLGFCWDNDFNEVGFNPNTPGFVGITFFQGPVGDAGDTLGLTRFTLVTNETSSRPQPDPKTDAEQYDLMAGLGTRAPFIDVVPSDMRFVEISGPVTFRPGETQRVVAGYVWANVSHGRSRLETPANECFPQGEPCFLPDPNDPALEELVQVQRAAQEVYDAGFLVPGPPPKPDITLIPGDRQVAVVWSDVSKVPDPFFSIAGDSANGAFDPLFREFDLEGYVVVRSTSGLSADVDTLAIFDVANDVDIINDTTLQQFTIGDSVVTLVTNVSEIISLPNTGLQFSFTDQGLINGITYFYDVVPFDFNPSNTLRGPEISRSAGISFQPAAGKSARPRSNASSFRSADVTFEALKADGTVCDTDEPTATVDENTGHYIDFLDCSNAIVDATLTPLRDLNIPSGEFDFVIDSILPNDAVNPYSLDDFGGYQLAVGFNTVWYHWEKGGGRGLAGAGQLATEIQPTVGFFNQNFDFTHADQTPVGFDLDTDPSDVGGDLSIALTIASDFSVMEDLEVNGKSLHLEELGATAHNERRPHRIDGSSLADHVYLDNIRTVVNAREYAHPGVYAQGGASYELTWSVSRGSYTGTMRKLPGGEIVPQGGQPKGPNNPSTPGDFIAGYNWGFIGPSDPTAVQAAVFPTAAPLINTISLHPGDTFATFVPGQSVYIGGIRSLPLDGEAWRFLIDTGSDRSTADPCAGFFDGGREPCGPTPPFSYLDVNDGGNVSTDRGIVNVYPGSRWRLVIAGGSNDPANVDLDRIKTVPNPYVANAVWDFSQDDQLLEFTNLPPVCTIRIYTISGNLVRVLEHTNESGTEVWDLQTRSRLKAASGTYYWHVTTPDGGTKLGLMSIIQGEPAAN